MLSLPRRESEGTLESGKHEKEADDIRAVIEHFSGANRKIGGILGHSKGLLSNLKQIALLLHIEHVKFCTVFQYVWLD